MLFFLVSHVNLQQLNFKVQFEYLNMQASTPGSKYKTYNDKMWLVSEVSKKFSPEQIKKRETYYNFNAKPVSKCPKWLKSLVNIFRRVV